MLVAMDEENFKIFQLNIYNSFLMDFTVLFEKMRFQVRFGVDLIKLFRIM